MILKQKYIYKSEYDSDIEAELEQDNSEQNFDNEQEERDEIIPNDENEGPISQKYNALSPCVIIDNIHGTIKRCGDTYKLRKMRNLLGTWQIDQDAVQQVNNDHLKLGFVIRIFCMIKTKFTIPKKKYLKNLQMQQFNIEDVQDVKKFTIFLVEGKDVEPFLVD